MACLLFSAVGCYPVTGERAFCKASRLDPAIPVERSKDVPMMRIGSLPHPFGPIPVNYANPNRLGTHQYRESPLRSIRLAETTAGTIYTQRVGFIDLAHTRNAADLTWYAYRRILPALVESRPRVLLAGAEPTIFILHLDYPEPWAALEPAQRERLAEQCAVVLAVRMGYVISTWHEVLTAFGYHSVFGIPEHQSAFVYDDQPSHQVGAVAAGRAIELTHLDAGRSFNHAMTEALEQVIGEVQPLDAAGSRRAVVAARGQWWGVEGTTARQVHLGMLGEPFEPMLIHDRFPEVLGDLEEAEDSAGGLALPWQVPSLADLAAQTPEWAGVLPAERVEIDPVVSYAEEILTAAGLDAPWLDLDRDGPALKAHLIDRLTDQPVGEPVRDREEPGR